MVVNFNQILTRLQSFYQDTIDMPNIQDRLFSFLFSEITNDLKSKNIKNFGDWLSYYSTDGNNFHDVVSIVESYCKKAGNQDFSNITIQEQIMMINGVSLYALEMDIDEPKGEALLSKILAVFVETIMKYEMNLNGYLVLEGEIFISDKTHHKFKVKDVSLHNLMYYLTE